MNYLHRCFWVSVFCLLAGSCKQEKLDLTGWPCEDGACTKGYQCHPEKNLCVPAVVVDCSGKGICPESVSTGDACPSAGSFIPCQSGETGCDEGCRTCRDNGTWSGCSKAPSCDEGLPCDDNDPCTYNDTCTAGICAGTSISCVSDECTTRTCQGTATCAVVDLTGPTCKPDGSYCDVIGECRSRSCVTHVCCNAVCGGDCESCLGAETGDIDGSCLPKLTGLECRAAAGECDVAEVCDGASTDCPPDDLMAEGTKGATGSCGTCQNCDGFTATCVGLSDQQDDGCDSPCHYCNGGGCTYLTSGRGYGCTALATTCSDADTCDVNGNCQANDLSGQKLGCDTPCHYCDGGICAYLTSGRGYGCATLANICSDDDSCDPSGTCLANDFPEGQACGTPPGRTCDGAGSCNITFVQTSQAWDPNVLTTTSVSFPAKTGDSSVGSFLIAVPAWNSDTVNCGAPCVADTQGNTWTCVGDQIAPFTPLPWTANLCFAPVAGAGDTDDTPDEIFVNTDAAAAHVLYIYEYQGVGGVDAACTASGITGDASCLLTTTLASALLFGQDIDGGIATGPGASFVKRNGVYSDVGEDRAVTSVGTWDINVVTTNPWLIFGLALIAAPDPRLVAFWRFDEASGQTLIDGSPSHLGGDGYLGTTSDVDANDPTRVAGRVNGALSFNGVDQIASFPASGAPGSLSAFTYLAWINPVDGGSFGIGRIISRESAVEFDDSYFFLYSNGELCLDLQNTTGPTQDTCSQTGALAFNGWNFIAATYDDSVDAADRKPHLYINGYEVTYSIQPLMTGMFKFTNNPFMIGNRPTLNRGFNGLIDEVRIYQAALSADEILSLYEGTP